MAHQPLDIQWDQWGSHTHTHTLPLHRLLDFGDLMGTGVFFTSVASGLCF
jgi:hypothetical protein